MSVAVMFAVQVAAGVMIDEGSLATVRTVAPELLPSDYLPGRLVLVAAGQPVVRIEDDLDELTVACLEAVGNLYRGQPGVIGFTDAPGRIDLVLSDGIVRLHGDVPPFEAPAADLLPAIRECCRRFVAWARTDLADRPTVQQRLNYHDQWLAEAAP
jgi:hypothetical protein